MTENSPENEEKKVWTHRQEQIKEQLGFFFRGSDDAIGWCRAHKSRESDSSAQEISGFANGHMGGNPKIGRKPPKWMVKILENPH